MGYKIGDLVIGKVNQIRPYALFLTFDNDVKGLLHISEISDSYIRDIEKFGSIGDEIKLSISASDIGVYDTNFGVKLLWVNRPLKM